MTRRTAEPVFGSLIPYYGLRRVSTRGKAGAHKTMLLTAVTYTTSPGRPAASHWLCPAKTPGCALAQPIDVEASQPAASSASENP